MSGLVVTLVLAALLAAMVAVIATLYRRVGSREWGRSDLRMSTLAFLAAVGPMFGIRVGKPRAEPPALSDTNPGASDVGPVTDLHERIADDDELQQPPPVRARGGRRRH